MADPYATHQDLVDWLPSSIQVDAGESARLRARASTLIDRAVLARYELDDVTGLPTDASIAKALSDATCAQLEQWFEVGEENDIDGLAGTQISVTGYSGKRAPRLAPRAADILVVNGLRDSQWLDNVPLQHQFFLLENG